VDACKARLGLDSHNPEVYTIEGLTRCDSTVKPTCVVRKTTQELRDADHIDVRNSVDPQYPISLTWWNG
jgi:hypothetical protein